MDVWYLAQENIYQNISPTTPNPSVSVMNTSQGDGEGRKEKAKHFLTQD